MMPLFPASTLILDIIHATEWLWNTPNALLARQTDAVITALEAEGHDLRHTASQ